MKALIAFIGMALVIIVLIEINERVKAKKKPTSDSSIKGREGDCQKENPEQEDCSGCGLVDVCEKEEKKKTGR